MREKKDVIAAFDFDGTITKKDSLPHFIIFCVGKLRFVTGLLIFSPVLLLYKMGIVENWKAKEIMFSYFFKGWPIDNFNKKCRSYSNLIKDIVRDSTIDKIREHQQANHTVVIVSASISNWIKPWAFENKIAEVIGTEIEINNGLVTGKFASHNCYGQEKVNRLQEKYPNRKSYILYAYGDSRGDKELLEFADYPTLINKE